MAGQLVGHSPTMRDCNVVIVGDPADVHVEAIQALLPAESTLVVDAQSLSESAYYLDEESFCIEVNGSWQRVNASTRTRGWMRRLSTPTWNHGVTVGSLEAAGVTAWLSILGALGRSSLVTWLSGLDNTLIAENKLYQLEVARRIGVRVPGTISTNTLARVEERFPNERIVKPLGPGNFVTDGQARVMYTQLIRNSDLEALRTSPPLIFQEHLAALAHLRVVVVKSSVWACELNATGLPVDWRMDDQAHDAFSEIVVPASIALGAVAINRALKLGYSSQDWIKTNEGYSLVDVNPGGQWLFLPRSVSERVSASIADWLVTHA